MSLYQNSGKFGDNGQAFGPQIKHILLCGVGS